jgi:dolichyl-phosphate-mannose--protein O-mannosyl transferase
MLLGKFLFADYSRRKKFAERVMFPLDAVLLLGISALAAWVFAKQPHFVRQRRQLARANKMLFRVLTALLAALWVVVGINTNILFRAVFGMLFA